MKYRVRNADGELTFASFGQIEQAWLSGLVGPDDEILEEGRTRWRKASSIPLLAGARRHGNQVWGGSQAAWIVIGITLSSVALYFTFNGRPLIGLTLAIAVAVLLFRVTQAAFKRTKPHG